jgi:glycosyltransferase involved in cell wall biosynthesis
MSAKPPTWICCQLGSREHYAIPRALNRQLIALITDAWVTPQSLFNKLPKPVLTKLRERFHVDLDQASVYQFTTSLIYHELRQYLQKITGWDRMISRNHWFQRQSVQALEKICQQANFPADPTLFAYSYAALDILRFAKNKGWRTILGQIDPGPFEEELVLKEHLRRSNYQVDWQPAPAHYWEMWREECALADRIMVNSAWSSQALQKVGIAKDKINIVPLAYQPTVQSQNFVRSYPQAFSAKRPLRVLFLGQVILRKGIAALLEAAELLRDAPVEFWIVGQVDIKIPEQYRTKLHWIGAVPRGGTAQYYQQADVFLFPTLSDGFGLTQLEAQAWKLPVIASQFCGEVVQNERNGMVLTEVSANAIAEAIKFCVNHPAVLTTYARASERVGLTLSELQHYLNSI